jgi:hypothetical protein
VALAPLATTADMTARGITVADEAMAGVFLDVASAVIRDAAGVPISRVTSTVAVWGDGSQWLRLPGPPIISVASAEIDGEAVTGWVLRDGRLWRRCGWESCEDPPAPVTVTQTHGLDPVPADVVDLACRMAASALIAATEEDDGSGLALSQVAAERLGDYSVTYRGDAGTTEMELSDRVRARLGNRFGGGGARVVTVG